MAYVSKRGKKKGCAPILLVVANNSQYGYFKFIMFFFLRRKKKEIKVKKCLEGKSRLCYGRYKKNRNRITGRKVST
jgi:hypothetical protein